MKIIASIILTAFMAYTSFLFKEGPAEMAMPLSGSYTIGGGSPNYTTISHAISDLTTLGIDGPVIFNIRNGSYVEQLSIGTITGTSPTNTITFRSESMDSNAVVISYDSPFFSNYVFQITNTDYLALEHLTFESADLTYSRVFTLSDTVENLTIQNCVIRAIGMGNYNLIGTNVEAFNLTIKNCLFENNGYAIHLDGSFNNGNRIGGLLIENNIFSEQQNRAIYLNDFNSPTIRDNVITSQSTNSTSKISIQLSFDSIRLINNKIDVPSSLPAIDLNPYRTTSGIGDCKVLGNVINLDSGNGLEVRGDANAFGTLEISGNIITIENGTYGIEYYYEGTASQRARVINNFCQIGGTGTKYGFYGSGHQYTDIYYNSFNITPGAGVSYAYWESCGRYNDMVNNVFHIEGTGYPLYVTNCYTEVFDRLDHNGYYSDNGTIFYRGSEYSDFESYQSAWPVDSHSVFAPAFFINDTSYQLAQIAFNNSGTPSTSVTVDIEGEVRSVTTPDIGADEFVPPPVDASTFFVSQPDVPFSAGSYPVKAIISNAGTDLLTSADVSWSVNDVPQGTINWTGSLISIDTAHINLGSYLFQPGINHEIKAWTSNPNGGSDGLAINDTASRKNVFCALNGSYTLGGVSPVFADFTTLQDQLNIGGVLGSVQIDVRDGSYNEQIHLEKFPGLIPSYTVTIRGESGDSSLVDLNYFSPSSDSNYVVKLTNAQGIKFEKITMQSLNSAEGRVLFLVDTVRDLSIEKCRLIGNDGTNDLIYGNDVLNVNTLIQNSRLVGNEYAINLEGVSNGGNYVPGLRIENNQFVDQMDWTIYLRYYNSPQITSNLFTSQGTSSNTKIRLFDAYDSIAVTGNQFILPNGGGGIYVDANRTTSGIGDVIVQGNFIKASGGTAISVTGNGNLNGTAKIFENIADLSNGGTGISIAYVADPANRSLIANNYIHVGGTNTKYGINGDDHENTDIYHNSINVTGSGSNGYGYWEHCGQATDMVNNIFNVDAEGYAIYVRDCQPGVFLRSDYNAYYQTNMSFHFRDIDYSSFDDYRGATGTDTNSIFSPAFFLADSSYNVAQVDLHDAGLPGLVSTDIEGETRDAMPDIGADEFDLPVVDAGIMEIVVPESPIPLGTHLIQAAIKNHGTDPLTSLNLIWKINNVAQATVMWSGNLASGDSTLVDLDSLSMIIGQSYRIDARSSSPNSGTDLIAVNDSAFVDQLYAGLSGTYTLGGTLPDFPDFQTLENHLNFGGVYGPVWIDVRDGMYTHRLILNEIPGSDTINTLTFRSESGDSSLVELNFNSTSSFEGTIQLNGTDYVTFEKLTLKSNNISNSEVVILSDTVEHVTFQNCAFQANGTSDYHIFGFDFVHHNMTIRQNYFNGNGYAIRLNAEPNGGLYNTNTLIEKNLFENQNNRAIWTRYMRHGIIRDNMITTTTTSNNTKINLEDCYDENQIIRNTISAPNGGNGMSVEGFRSSNESGDLLVKDNEIFIKSQYGLELEGSGDSFGTLICTDNIISVISGARGISYSYEGHENRRALLANNMIQIGGTSTKYGLYGILHTYTDMFHNTVNVTPSSGTSYGYYDYRGRLNDVTNNIFNVEGSGNALYVIPYNSDVFSRIDYNDYRNLSGNLIYYRGTNYADLTAYQAGGWGVDSNSFTIDPLFANDTFDLHVTNVLMNDLGTPVPEVTTDIDGESRDPVMPDVGADEFGTVANNLSIYRLDSPTGLFPSGNQQVLISVLSSGADTLHNFTVQWEINGEAQLPFDWSGEVVTGQTLDSLVIGSVSFEVDSNYKIKLWTENPNGQADQMPADDTIAVSNLYAALGGVYTIGGVEPDFQSFQRALTALDLGGVIDSVIFNVRDGSYNERLELTEYEGVDSLNRITFQSESGDSSAVTLSYAGTVLDSTYVVILDGADYITFKNMTIASDGSYRPRVVNFKNGAHWNAFIGNHIKSDIVSVTNFEYSLVGPENSQINEHNYFINNTFTGGAYAFRWISDDNYSDDIRLINNVFRDQYSRGLFTQYISNFKIIGNTFSTIGTNENYYAIQPNSNGRGLRIEGNNIVVGYNGRGIVMSGHDDQGTNTYAIVANNFITCNGAGSVIGISGTSTDRVKFVFNTVRVNSTSPNAKALSAGLGTEQYVYNNILANFGPGEVISMIAGNWVTDSDYNNFYTNGSVLGSHGMDADDLASWQSATGFDANSFSLDPLFINDSSYVVEEIEMNDNGTPVAEVAKDFEEESRDPESPDLGVNEFNPIIPDDIGVVEILSPNRLIPFSGIDEEVFVSLRNNGSNTVYSAEIHWVVDGIIQYPSVWADTLEPGERDTIFIGTTNLSFKSPHTITAYSKLPNAVPDNIPKNDTTKVTDLYAGLDGIYTIGGILPDFDSIHDATLILNEGGVLGPVELRIRNGTYEEQLEIREVNGSSVMNTVTFKSESGDTALVKIEYTGTYNKPYTIVLDDADHITFENLTLQSNDRNYGSVVYLRNQADSNRFVNNLFVSEAGTWDALVFSSSADLDNANVFLENTFLRGNRAIDLRGFNSNTLQKGTRIERNRFIDQPYEAIYLEDHLGPVIRENSFSNPNSTPYSSSISLNDCDGLVFVEENTIIKPNGSGIYLLSCAGFNSIEHPKVINNVIALDGIGSSNGIHLFGCYLVDVAHNSVHLFGANTTSKSYFDIWNSNNTTVNNVFANTGGGYAIRVYQPNGNTSDKNDLYVTGSYVGSWLNTDITDLSNWQIASGQEVNSISINPLFYSDVDLHVLQVALDSSALVYGQEWFGDFEGDSRNPNYPDIGADEFDVIPDDLGIIDVIHPTDTCELTDMESLTLVIQNFGGASQTGFDIEIILNGDTLQENTGGLVVLPGDTVHYRTMSTVDLSAYQIHLIEVKTVLATELNQGNDTHIHEVQNYQLPVVPMNMLPVDGSMNVLKPATLSWQPSAGATSYDLYIWPDTATQPLEPYYKNLTQISAVVNQDEFQYGNTYAWQIVAKNPFCATASPIQYFTFRELPDLTAKNIQVPNMPFSGQQVSVSWNVENNGAGSTLDKVWYDQVYLSADDFLDINSDIYLGALSNLAALDTGGSYAQIIDVILPKEVSGPQFLIIHPNGYHSVLERDFENNPKAEAITITLTPPPDLQVTLVNPPNNVFSGQEMTLSYTVTNMGTGDVEETQWVDYVYISDNQQFNLNDATYLAQVQRSNVLLPSGQSYLQGVYVEELPEGIFGDYFIHVFVDRVDDVFEFAFESNNVGTSDTVNVILTPPPDLIIPNVFVPDTLYPSQVLTMSYFLKNVGAGAAIAPWRDRIYISEVDSLDESAAVLATIPFGSSVDNVIQFGETKGRGKQVTIPSNYEGEYYLHFHADYRNQLFEFNADENNFFGPDTVQIVAPDLQVENIAIPDTAYAGQLISIQWTIRNASRGQVFNQQVTDEVFISSSATFDSTAIFVGQLKSAITLLQDFAVQRNKSMTLPNGLEGDYYLHLVSDANDEIFEGSNENNNTLSTPIHVPLPASSDLQVSSYGQLPDTAITIIDSIPITFEVSNLGQAVTPSNAWKDVLYLSIDSVWNDTSENNFMLGEQSRFAVLDTNENYTVTFNVLFPMVEDLVPGRDSFTFYLYAITDIDEQVYEHSALNNNNVLRSQPIFLICPTEVDLDVVSVSPVSDTLETLQELDISWIIQNIGTNTEIWGYDFWYNGIYLSNDPVWDEDDLLIEDFTQEGPFDSLELYSNEQTIIIPDVPSGVYCLMLVADNKEYLDEESKTNNVEILPVIGPAINIFIKRKLPPNLVAKSFTAPVEGITGQPIEMTFEVKNEGLGVADELWVDKVYLSTDFEIDYSDRILYTRIDTPPLLPNVGYLDTVQAVLPTNVEGNFILIFKTDANNQFIETDQEADNLQFAFMTISRDDPTDLVVQSVSAPSAVMVNEKIDIDFEVKNIGQFPADGLQRDILYLSSDSTFDVGDIQIGIREETSQLAPGETESRSIEMICTPGVALGDYHIIVQTDALNNIYEISDANNVYISSDKISIQVEELPINVLTPNTLPQEGSVFYRIEVPDTLVGETMEVTLTSNTPGASNELYLSYGAVPNRSMHDFAHSDPFASAQKVTIPELDSGTYYLMIYGQSTSGQNIDIIAEIIPFFIREIDDNEGGNTGKMTARITGAKFTENMMVELMDPALDTISALQLYFINSTEVYATFDLNGAVTGIYDLVITKPGNVTTSLTDGFTIVNGPVGTIGSIITDESGFTCEIKNLGTENLLSQNIVAPEAVRVGRIVPITIQFANNGSMDIPCPQRFILSVRGAPLSFSSDDFSANHQELLLVFEEEGGPPGILRPGASGAITVFSLATRPLKFYIQE